MERARLGVQQEQITQNSLYEAGGNSSAAFQVSGALDDLGPLPDGFEMEFTENGRKFL